MFDTSNRINNTKRYFDSASFTPPCKEAQNAVDKMLKKQGNLTAGNQNTTHSIGDKTKKLIENAKKEIGNFFAIKGNNVIFTSGATEANYTAIHLAVAKAYKNNVQYKDMHIVSTIEEHTSLLAIFEYFRTLGIEITLLNKDENENYSPTHIAKHIKENTICVSIHYVNSINGKIQNISAISNECKKKKDTLNTKTSDTTLNTLTVHTDAAQALAYLNCQPEALSADLVTIDSGKIFGPQGIGALLVNKSKTFNGVKTHSGGIIGGLQSGTQSAALILGFAEAIKKLEKEQNKNIATLRNLQMYTINELRRNFPDICIHTMEKANKKVHEKNTPHIIYASIAKINHSYLLTLLDKDGYSVSTTTACRGNSGDGIRIGLLPTHRENDIKNLIKAIKKNIHLSLLI